MSRPKKEKEEEIISVIKILDAKLREEIAKREEAEEKYAELREAYERLKADYEALKAGKAVLETPEFQSALVKAVERLSSTVEGQSPTPIFLRLTKGRGALLSLISTRRVASREWIVKAYSSKVRREEEDTIRKKLERLIEGLAVVKLGVFPAGTIPEQDSEDILYAAGPLMPRVEFSKEIKPVEIDARELNQIALRHACITSAKELTRLAKELTSEVKSKGITRLSTTRAKQLAFYADRLANVFIRELDAESANDLKDALNSLVDAWERAVPREEV